MWESLSSCFPLHVVFISQLWTTTTFPYGISITYYRVVVKKKLSHRLRYIMQLLTCALFSCDFFGIKVLRRLVMLIFRVISYTGSHSLFCMLISHSSTSITGLNNNEYQIARGKVHAHHGSPSNKQMKCICSSAKARFQYSASKTSSSENLKSNIWLC